MANRKQVELPSEEQVAAYFEAYLPPAMAISFTALFNDIINMQSVDVDTGDNEENVDDAPAPRAGRGRGRAAEVEQNNDDAPPARRGRGAPVAAADDLLNDDDLLSNDDDAANTNEDDAPPARRGAGRGRAAAEDNNDDAPPARRGRGAAAVEENNDDDAPPARRGPAAARNNNNDDAPAPRGRGRAAPVEPEPQPQPELEPIAFADLGGSEKTVGEYTDAFLAYKNAKAIKDEVTGQYGINLKGTDKPLLAEQAAEIYVAMETLSDLPLAEIDNMLVEFNVEVDYGRTKSEKTKVAMAAKALVEVALESFS